MPSRERALLRKWTIRDYDGDEYTVVSPVRRQTVAEAQAEFTRGNIDVFELERRVALALEHEPTDKIMLESTPEKESTMETVRRAGGLAALGAAVFLALLMIAVLAIAVASLMVHLLSM